MSWAEREDKLLTENKLAATILGFAEKGYHGNHRNLYVYCQKIWQ